MAHRPSATDWIARVAAIEAGATGLLLLASPPLFARLILGADLTEPGSALGRLGGVVLIGLALACWPAPTASVAQLRALTIYNLLVGADLAWLGSTGPAGVLLWPAVILHVALAFLVARAWRQARRA
ncbi:hypothetical protein [Caulobacter sp. 17J65-9]|uniref:hypothetical protein n=1 Tax=Caulobacter sp. 17J65-9 TaxID=2709382 RepID=UPI0013C6A54F|nr:hypothetical protein [Caulobacter sp. 17J65-9]NEX91921.1 hypothetical protein [Caulobacter sp. 17J65-9]